MAKAKEPPVAGVSRFPAVPEPDSRYYAPLRDACLSQHGAWADYPWGETAFKVGKKIFATFYQREDGDLSITVKATLEDQAGLVQLPGFEKSAYIGQHGWVTAKVADDQTFELLRDLIPASYELVAHPAKRAKGKEQRA